MLKAFFAGSFNPFHTGHYNILTKSFELFQKVYIVISTNTNKPALTSLAERYSQITAFLKDHPVPANRCQIITNANQLTVNLAQKYGVSFLVRGLRNNHDLEKELELEKMNKLLDPKIQTVYLTSDFKHVQTSSTLLRELKKINTETYFKITSQDDSKSDD